MNKKSVKGFYQLSRQEYYQDVIGSCDYTDEFLIGKFHPGDGCEYEFAIRWYKQNQEEAARVEIFSDAFIVFEDERRLFTELSRTKKLTKNELYDILMYLDYKDLSDVKK